MNTPPTALQNAPTRKILLVEDSFHDADLTMHAVKKCGIINPTQHVLDGAEGLALLHADPDAFGLAIVDLKMPGMDGFDFLARVRADERLHALPTILATTSVLEVDRIRAQHLGVSRYVVKSLDLADYVEALCAAITPFRDALADGRTIQT